MLRKRNPEQDYNSPNERHHSNSMITTYTQAESVIKKRNVGSMCPDKMNSYCQLHSRHTCLLL